MAIRAKFDRAQVVARAYQRWKPASGVDESQGQPYFYLPGVQQQLDMPADPGIDIRGWLNPFTMTSYQVAVPTLAPIKAIPGNMRRTYLIIQNLGPGNLYVNFGTDAGVGTSMVLITTQFYEQIGGGSFDYDKNHSVANSFVTRDYVSVLADAANTFCIVTEGLWNFVQREVLDLVDTSQR